MATGRAPRRQLSSRPTPFTGDVAGSAAAAKREDARAAADAAAAAFPEWAATPSDAAPRAAPEGLRAAEGARASRSPGSSPPRPAAPSAGACSTAMLAAGMLQRGRRADHAGHRRGHPLRRARAAPPWACASRRAWCVGIAPWNAPMILGTRAVAQPLAFGNTVVLKASEVCPRTHGEIARALADAGLPPGVINLITHERRGRRRRGRRADRPPGGAARSTSPAPRASAGSSPRTRRATSSACCSSWAARRRLSCSPTPTSTRRWPPRSSAPSCTRARSACRPSGSWSTARCSTRSPSKLAERAAALKVGDPRDPETQIGPMVNAGSVERVAGLVEDARRARRRGGHRRRGGRPAATSRPCSRASRRRCGSTARSRSARWSA